MFPAHSKYRIVFCGAVLLLAIFCLLPIGNAASASETLPNGKLILSFHGYKITAYDVAVKVYENNVLDVTERITAHFDEPKHGIYRSIPLENTMRWFINQETSTHTQKARISNISVTDGSTGQELPLDKETTAGQLVLKIGDAGTTITGEKTYVIRYCYALGNDGRKEFDELYYNLIGDKWDTYIGNIRFSLEMPKAFDPKNLTFMLGTAEAGALVPYKVEGNTIYGTVDDVLSGGRGLTVRLELPEGYFSGIKEDSTGFMGMLSLSFMVVSVLLFFLFGRNPRLQSGSGWPTECNPAEAGYILGGDAAKRGRMALLMHWAEQGYLCFETDELGRTVLVKLREADTGLKPYEKTLFHALFVNGKRVTPEMLKTQCSGIMAKVEREIRAFFVEPSRRLYTSASGTARKICYLFTLVCIGIVTAKIFGDAYSLTDYLSIAAGILAFSFMLFPFIGLIGYYARKNGTGSTTGLAVNIVGLLLMLGVLLGLLAYSDALDSESGLAVLAVGVCSFAGVFTRRRSEFGNRLLSQVLGLEQRMERSRQTTPEPSGSFYSLLPYAYVFGLSEQWAKVFDGLELEPPEWFRGRLIHLYSTMYFSNWASEQLDSFESSITYNDSSGGDSGGTSGGGAGGGGGGAW